MKNWMNAQTNENKDWTNKIIANKWKTELTSKKDKKETRVQIVQKYKWTKTNRRKKIYFIFFYKKGQKKQRTNKLKWKDWWTN